MSTPPGLPLYRRAELVRAGLGVSKSEFAAKAGIGRVTYDRLQTQAEPPIFRTVKKLCDVIGIPVEEGLQLTGYTVHPPGEGPPDLKTSVEALSRAVLKAADVLAAQTVMGWAYRGDVEAARRVLAGMSAEAVQSAALAASMMAELADEDLRSR